MPSEFLNEMRQFAGLARVSGATKARVGEIRLEVKKRDPGGRLVAIFCPDNGLYDDILQFMGSKQPGSNYRWFGSGGVEVEAEYSPLRLHVAERTPNGLLHVGTCEGSGPPIIMWYGPPYPKGFTGRRREETGQPQPLGIASAVAVSPAVAEAMSDPEADRAMSHLLAMADIAHARLVEQGAPGIQAAVAITSVVTNAMMTKLLEPSQ